MRRRVGRSTGPSLTSSPIRAEEVSPIAAHRVVRDAQDLDIDGSARSASVLRRASPVVADAPSSRQDRARRGRSLPRSDRHGPCDRNGDSSIVPIAGPGRALRHARDHELAAASSQLAARACNESGRPSACWMRRDSALSKRLTAARPRITGVALAPDPLLPWNDLDRLVPHERQCCSVAKAALSGEAAAFGR
jgi:hypothetical protein